VHPLEIPQQVDGREQVAFEKVLIGDAKFLKGYFDIDHVAPLGSQYLSSVLFQGLDAHEVTVVPLLVLDVYQSNT
jgi:hypothetical protein